MTREERVAALARGLKQCQDRDPDSLDRMLEAHKKKGRFAPGGMIRDDDGACG